MYQDNQHKYSRFEKKYICSDLGGGWGGGVIIYNITSMILEESVFQFFSDPPINYFGELLEKQLRNINIAYNTVFGFFQILSFICLICTWAGSNLACDYTYGSSYGFFEFVAGSVFLTDVINYLIFALTIDEKWCMKFVPWLVWVRQNIKYFL